MSLFWMFNHWNIFIFCLIWILDSKIYVYTEEYCLGESFEPNCGDDAVILMKKALYGRMRLGRCVDKNRGLLGCSSNVLNYMDTKCSGKFSCSIEVRDQFFVSIKPCEDLTSHLEVEYTCLPVSSIPDSCQICPSLKFTKEEGYISNIQVHNTKCGSFSCPITVESKKGQNIHISLLDFSENKTTGISNGCNEYAYLREPTNEKSTTVCQNGKKYSSVYKTTQNLLEIEIISQIRHTFLLHYQFEGCPDITRSQVIFTRNEKGALIKCKNSNHQKQLTCDKTKWIEDTSLDCKSNGPFKSADGLFGFQAIGWEFLTILVICVTFLIGSCLFVLILWSRSRIINTKQETIYDEPVRNTPYIYRDVNTLQHQKYNSYDPRTQRNYIDRSTYDTLHHNVNDV